LAPYYAICPYPVGRRLRLQQSDCELQSVTSHEITEAATDPSVGSGWWQEARKEAILRLAGVALPFGTVQRFDDNLQLALRSTPRRKPFR